MPTYQHGFEALATALHAQGIDVDAVKDSLKAQRIETPSWGYGNSGTRFHVFPAPGAARNIYEKVADATNYAGQDNIRARKHHLLDALRQVYDALPEGARMLIEYKFFEPAFYHTDLAD